MPRGVYDRSKTKEQREAEKAAKAGKPKRKYTKRAAAADAPKRKYTRKVDNSSGPVKAQSLASSFVRDNALVLMSEVRSNINVLSGVGATFGDLPSVATEIEAQVAVLGQLSKKVFSDPPAEESVAGVEDDENTESDETGAQENGAVVVGSVPLPPPPPVAPILPTTH